MTVDRLLFLLGGAAAYQAYAADFVAAAGGSEARIVTFTQSAAGWEKHREEITRFWRQRGVTQIEGIFPNPDGQLDLEQIAASLSQASGIFIGGGKTQIYHRLYATGRPGELIRQRHLAGVPVAGISAGALLALEHCQLVSEETGLPDMEIVPGLGLASGFVLGVHFSEWNALPEVLTVMTRTQSTLAYGLDETAGLVCRNGHVEKTLGRGVQRIEMTDFAAQNCLITPWLAYSEA